jgi:hypothetical protein
MLNGGSCEDEGKTLTITCDHDKLVVVCDVMLYYVGVCSDDLVLRDKAVVLLEVEVADGSRESEIA